MTRKAEKETRLTRLLRQTQGGAAVEVRESGHPPAVLLSRDRYDQLVAAAGMHADVVKGLADIAAGRVEPWAKVRDELLVKLDAAERSQRKKAKRA